MDGGALRIRMPPLPSRPTARRMHTCSKTYADIPFAHRQHRHAGHCRLVHGHNWTITVHFAADTLDANGFVIDFGALGFLRDWIRDHLDHACVFNADDPLRETLVAAAPEAWKVLVVPSCSAEGLARHLLETFEPMVAAHSGGRVRVAEVEVWEDARNAARYRP